MPATPCPDCGAVLPDRDGPTHAYIGGSAACWDVFTKLNAGEPEVALTPWSPLLTDAYCAQHRGGDSPRARQSVAVHALTLQAVLDGGARPSQAVSLRVRCVEVGRRVGGWEYLDPWPEWPLTVHDVVEAPDPDQRAAMVERYVRSVWETLAGAHPETLESWQRRLAAG